GGGLAMVVTGLVRELTADTADRVALGAGAIVLDVISMNDGRTAYRKIEDLKRLRPDMVLLAGGYDGEAITAPVFLAELLVESDLHPKLNPNAKLPVVYAGNIHAGPYVKQALSDRFMFRQIPNVRPTEELENVHPARAAIHEIFMDHVMSMAPGYDRLKPWVSTAIRPTPAAVADLLALVSRGLDAAVLAIDIGGATTDVFSAYRGSVMRTVSANIGMSYSMLNVARLAGTGPIADLLDFQIGENELWNRIGNKHVNPTSLPRTPEDAMVEWATGTVAIREAVREHLKVMRGVSDTVPPGPFDVNALLREEREKAAPPGHLVVPEYGLVIGSGGILSHSPREAAAMMLTNALALDGHVELAVDRAFMFPHLGVLSEMDADLARELFFELALVKLGTVGEAGPIRPASEVAAERYGADMESPARTRPRPGSGPSPQPGPIRMRRELAIEGTVLVKAGDVVESDTVIARSARQFLRPFFLNVARVMQADPRDLADIMTRKVGDDVSREEIIAEQPRRIGRPHVYRSQVDGRIEKILPDGTVVVRENPEKAQVLTTVRASDDLGVYPDRLKPYLRVAIGDEVERGQWLAAKTAGGSFKRSESPVRGRVSRIDEHFGMVMIEPLLEELEVLAWLPGTVQSASERGCTIASEGIDLYGVWGSGGETHGLLTMGRIEAGCVAVLEHADEAAINECRQKGAAGLIAGGVNLRDVLDPKLGFTLIVTEGFGASSMGEELSAVLEAHEGHRALIDGTTQLRVGVRRPRIILPSAAVHSH
ncbi:MAG: glutamate mutase L, partial [Candidatus Eisenbacteria bacterium]|nr:glutamate mutase L [Candidatus Eisenbacteria bacterium]